MKATIDENGFLEIKAETPLEAYALTCWLDTPSDSPRKGYRFITDISKKEPPHA